MFEKIRDKHPKLNVRTVISDAGYDSAENCSYVLDELSQPWKFIYGFRGDEVYTVLFDLINETNQVWAKTAPVLILSMAETIPPGRTSLNRFAFHDTGMAVGNLLAQATDLGLFVHQMGGYDNESAKTVLNLPATYEPLAMMAVGYKGDPAVLPEAVAAREEKRSERNPLEKFAFNRKI